MSASGREAAAAAANVAVIVALGIERAAFGTRVDRDPAVGILQSGPGAERAARAATTALASGASGLVSFGLAGGLRAGLAPGAVLLPRRVRSAAAAFAVDSAWHAALANAARGAGFAPSFEDLLSVAAALTTPAEKAAAAANGAAAVDMESAAIAAVAARAGARFVAVRVIVDGASDSLPADVEHWVDERGERRLGPALAAVLRPARWRELWVLARRYAAARRTLERLAPLVTDQRLGGDAGAVRHAVN